MFLPTDVQNPYGLISRPTRQSSSAKSNPPNCIRNMPFPTEFSFTLPRGHIDAVGHLHQNGRMRLATALDEIECVQDPRVQSNEAYLPVLLLRRVIIQLGNVEAITPELIAGLYVIDLAYLEDLYQRINQPDPVMMGAVCPSCSQQFQLQVAPLN